MEREEHSIAYDLLKELIRSNKRWFIIAMVELVIIVGMVIGFFVYESQYEYADETYQYVEGTDMQESVINQNLGE